MLYDLEYLSEMKSKMEKDRKRYDHEIATRNCRLRTIERLEVMEAYLEGKTIECIELGCDEFGSYPSINSEWKVCEFPDWDFNCYEYRVKSEKKYVPFTDAEDFLKHINHKDDVLIGNEFYTAYVNSFDEVMLVGALHRDTHKVSFKELFETCTFLDGTPCGKIG